MSKSSAHPKLASALSRNLTELNNCILKKRAYNAFLRANPALGLDFFRIAITAIQNDMYAGAHRAFDRHKDAASIWYIQRIAPNEFAAAVDAAGVDLSAWDAIAAKLVHIRDRTHFHIDKSAVADAKKIWTDADLSGNEFNHLTESAHEVLRLINIEVSSEDRPVPDYNGEDVENILKAYKAAFPNASISI